MLKNAARDLWMFGSCLPWRTAAATGLWGGSGAPVQFVIEKADWAIRWVGEHICDQTNLIVPGTMQTTVEPQRIVRRVVHFGSQYMWLAWGGHMSRSNRFVVSYFHGKPEDGPEAIRHIEQFLASVERLDKIVTAGSIVESRLLEWGVPREKLIRIPIGVDTQSFTMPDGEARCAARKEFGIPEHAIVVGSFQKDGVGWGDGMEPKLIKGPDIFVDAMCALKSRGLPVMAFLTGPARGYVKARLDSAGIPYVHSYVKNHADLVLCYHALDVYLVTSREEGGPMGLMESMASGVPVVSTRVGMAPDLIEDGQTGNLVSMGDIDQMADRAAELVFSPNLSELRVRARTKVMAADWSVVGKDHWNKVYQPLLLE